MSKPFNIKSILIADLGRAIRSAQLIRKHASSGLLRSRADDLIKSLLRSLAELRSNSTAVSIDLFDKWEMAGSLGIHPNAFTKKVERRRKEEELGGHYKHTPVVVSGGKGFYDPSLFPRPKKPHGNTGKQRIVKRRSKKH